MYNLLVTADTGSRREDGKGAWEREFYEYDKSRFLEYTNEKLAKHFKHLTDETIEQLKSLPCLFAYEGTKKNVRIGYLTEIKDRGRNILIQYTFYDDIPEIPFSTIEPISPLLDIRDWEMNRTHWAVKDEDLLKILQEYNIIAIDDSLLAKSGHKLSLSTEKQTASRITTVKGFIGKVLSDDKEEDKVIFYRGHSDKEEYKLEPSLFRRDKQGNYLYQDNEDVLYRELIVSSSSAFSSDSCTLDRLVRMQHYSLPTRLLDITSNPLIALYFSCKSNPKKDGEVIALSVQRGKMKYFDSDTASCLANLARLPKKDKELIKFTEGRNEFNEQEPIQRLIHFIREEKPFFQANIDPEDLRSVICVKGKMSNDRIVSQSGAFLLFGINTVLDETGSTDIKVTRITVTNKEKILQELDLLNINEATVFPHIENSAKYVAKKYEFKATEEPQPE